MLLNACGGGSGDADIGASLASQNTSEDTGTAYITLTDAEGAFVTYSVDVTSIALERADGTLVETLPNAGRIDFARYVDLTEMFSSAQIPTGAYVGGAITLDYTTADIQVEVAGVAVPATVVDEDGAALGQYTLTVRLEEQDRLIVAPGRPALLEIDFDLDASHEVDTLQNPPLVTAAPFLVADVEPVDEKELRIRGPLVAVDIDASSYDLRLRPWHLRDGDFGPVTVNVTDATEYEIDGVAYTGGDGLTALAGLDAGT
ncbi:MAG: metallophosphoesterase, partial [Gammaproteobacteria bacterium]